MAKNKEQHRERRDFQRARSVQRAIHKRRHESKQARPYTIDTREDELEMLSEARARLANTKRREAKRKTRQKQLAEARRLATLERRKDKKKIGKRRAEENPETIFEKKQEHKRSKLILPEPQVSDRELEDIVKIGRASDSIRDLIDENPTSTLLHDYSQAFNNAQAARTMRTPAALSDNIAKAADDLLAITNAETPLLGGKNAPLHTTDFTAPSSIRAAIQTPNTVLAAFAQTPKQLYDRTPGTVVSATPGGATPFRDELNINREAGRASVEELRQALKSLPAPKNDFEVVMPEEDDNDEEEDMDTDWAEDAGEIDSKRAAILEKKKAKALALRTEVFRRKLPMPSKINDVAFKRFPVKNVYDEADNLIRAEMRTLLKWDVEGIEPVEKFTLDELAAANALIDAEAARLGPFDEDEYMAKAVAMTSGRQVIVNGQAHKLEDLPPKEQVKAIKGEIESLTHVAKTIKGKSDKMQNKLKIILQGYEKIEENAVNSISKNQHDAEINAMELATFAELRLYEREAATRRIQRLEAEVAAVHEEEARLQKELADIAHQQWELNQKALRKMATTESEPVAHTSGAPVASNGTDATMSEDDEAVAPTSSTDSA